MRKDVFAHTFFAELCETHDADDAAFFVDRTASLQDACSRYNIVQTRWFQQYA